MLGGVAAFDRLERRIASASCWRLWQLRRALGSEGLSPCHAVGREVVSSLEVTQRVVGPWAEVRVDVKLCGAVSEKSTLHLTTIGASTPNRTEVRAWTTSGRRAIPPRAHAQGRRAGGD